MSETFTQYLPYIRQRWLRERQSWQTRREKAWVYARHAAAILREQGAQEVIAFGSLVAQGIYDERSEMIPRYRPLHPFLDAASHADQ